MIFFGQASLRHTITQYMTHYHGERNHQGIGNRLLQPQLVEHGDETYLMPIHYIGPPGAESARSLFNFANGRSG